MRSYHAPVAPTTFYKPRLKTFSEAEKREIMVYAEVNDEADAMRRYGVPRETFEAWKAAAAPPPAPELVVVPEPPAEQQQETPMQEANQEQEATQKKNPRGLRESYPSEVVNKAARLILQGLSATQVVAATGMQKSTVYKIAMGHHAHTLPELQQQLLERYAKLRTPNATPVELAPPVEDPQVAQLTKQNEKLQDYAAKADARIGELETLIDSRTLTLEAQLSKANARLRETEAALEQATERATTLSARLRDREQEVALIRADLIKEREQRAALEPVKAVEIAKLKADNEILRKAMGEYLVEAMIRQQQGATTP